MNIKRSYFHVLLASLTVGLLLTNCTVKEAEDDGCTKGKKHNGCDCSGGLVGYQVCGSDGTYGECVCGKGAGDDKCSEGDKASGCSCAGNTVGYQVCDGEGVYGSCVCPSGGGEAGEGSGGTNNTSGSGGSSYAGNSTSGSGGSAGSNVSPAGEGGAGGEGGGPDLSALEGQDCETCLATLCESELDDCLNDSLCISESGDGTGQFERIAECVNEERANGLVKRDAFRSCGVTIGGSPTSASLNDAWAPEGMQPATTNLLNCLATSSSEEPNADWANDIETNYPTVNNMVVPKPWPDDSCAKLSCTSQIRE